MIFHPAAQILAWCILVIMMETLSPFTLLVLSAIVLTIASVISRHKLVMLLRRTRWIMLSLMVVYACSTPGEALVTRFGAFSPTHEGLTDGALQLMRLLAALAALAVLLDRLHRQQLVAGLYFLLKPLQWLGISPDRLAVRLALTLHYAEAAMLREGKDWKTELRQVFEPHDEPVRQIELPEYRFGLQDAAMLLMFLVSAWALLR